MVRRPAFFLILRTLAQKVQQHYHQLDPSKRSAFKTHLRSLLEGGPHAVPVGLWARFLAEEWPDEYGDTGQPEHPLLCLPYSDGWYDVMQARVKARRVTHHPRDVDPVESDRLGYEVGRAMNGSTSLSFLTAFRGHCEEGGTMRTKVEGRRGNMRPKTAGGAA